jgi:TrkA domain protein
MTDINETRLPGVGIRFDFPLQNGGRIVLINHRSGRVEILLCSEDDPDACHEVLRLAKEDVKALAEVLGQSRVTEEVTRMQLSIEGLTIDWVNVESISACADSTLYEIEHRDEEAASIVAVIREEATIAAPPSTFVLKPGDVAVVVGTSEGVEALSRLLQTG